MHEYSYMVRLADLAFSELNKYPNAVPKKMVARVGELVGVESHYLKYYFPKVVAGSRLENANLDIIEVAAEAVCAECGKHYHPVREADYRCDICGSARARFVAGREFELAEIVCEEVLP